MKYLIHASPQRLRYVEKILYPSLREQGIPAGDIDLWVDYQGRGNLSACMDSFAARTGDGGTWHLQDDVLLCRDFAQRTAEHDEGVVFGFCCEAFGDDPRALGTVYQPDLWHSFQCVRIPDAWARECAEWFASGGWERSADPELAVLAAMGQGDDTMFRAFLADRHGRETGTNLGPCLVEHVDFLLGGSLLSRWRDAPARAALWAEPELVDALKTRIEELA